MVVKYANSEKQVMVGQNQRDALEKKIKELLKERDSLNEKIKGLNGEKSRVCNMMNDKVFDTSHLSNIDNCIF